MINSEPPDRHVLDHDLLVDFKGRVYVVVGNSHPPDGFIAYLKYIPTRTPTLWRWRGVWLKRVLKDYGVRNVVEVSEAHYKMRYDPALNSEVPFLRRGEVTEWLRPEDAMKRLLSKPEDVLEAKALDAVLRISKNAGLSPSSIGVGGSILLRSHNPCFSDINLTVYGCRETLNVALAEDIGLDPMPKHILARRIFNKSRIHSLPPDIVRELIPSYRKVAIGNTPVGITFVDSIPRRYGEEVLKPITRVKCTAHVEGMGCRSLFYPSRTKISECVFNRLDSLVDEEFRPDEVSEVVSYEGLFNYILFRGGCVRIEGILERRYPDGDIIILVGGKEHPGYVIPC